MSNRRAAIFVAVMILLGLALITLSLSSPADAATGGGDACGIY